MIWTVTIHTLNGRDEKTFEIEVSDYALETQATNEAYRELWTGCYLNHGCGASMQAADGTKYLL